MTSDMRERFRRSAGTGHFDLLVIGGGITGAGVALEGARAGLRVALVEQNDFASGTSSWSSKLVHGGLRYLASGDWRLTRESVRERQRLLRDVPGLVEPLDFMLPLYKGDRPGRLALKAALSAYDFMAGKRYSQYLDSSAFAGHMPYLDDTGLKGGFVYRDALTDDAGLTLRVLAEARAAGVAMANYVRADELLFDDEEVAGARLIDTVDGDHFTADARSVVNATGPWSDRLRAAVAGKPQLRPLRGSHFVFPFHRLPVGRAITLFHPEDRRPLFAIPWQGATVFGTTDLDHDAPMDRTPRMSEAESDYLSTAARHYFPALALDANAAVSSFAGVRPIIRGEDGASASDESRESAIDVEKGLITVTGGKLTTFRVTAQAVIRRVGAVLGRALEPDAQAPIFDAQRPGRQAMEERRRTNRYGPLYRDRRIESGDAIRIGTTNYCPGELRFALEHEAVVHLDDLLLRRTRLGLLLPGGGADHMDTFEPLIRATLGWDEATWRGEVERYLAYWQQVHAP